MAAVQDGDPVALRTDTQRPTWPQWLAFLTTAAGYALTLLVFYPGYSTVDARYVYAEAQAWQFGDWQSPVMAVLWRLVDPIAPGSLSMFLLAATLYWLSFGLLALVAVRRVLWLGLVPPLLAFVPPAFFFVGLVWRDILFGIIWLFAAVLALVAAERAGRLRIIIQAFALLLVALGVLLRPNAIFAAPFLAAYAVWPTRFDVRRMAIVFLPAVVLSYALVPLVYYGVLDAKRQNPLHSILVFDLGGTTHFTGENQFPVTWSAEQTALLTSKCYDPVRWDSYWHVPPCPFVMQRLERPDDIVFGTPRLVAAWWQAVSAHPLAYLRHRATFMWQFLARSNLVLPVWDWLDPASSYGHSRTFTPLVALHDRAATHPAVSAGPVAGPCHGDRSAGLADAIDAGRGVRRERDRLGRRLCHHVLRSRGGGRFPLRLLVRARRFGRRRGRRARPLRATGCRPNRLSLRRRAARLAPDIVAAVSSCHQNDRYSGCGIPAISR